MASREDIVSAARRYLGVRYLHQGRTRQGIDCAGLVMLVARDCDIPACDVMGYGRVPDGSSLRATLDQQASPVEQYQPGDILLLRFRRDPQHLAIVTDHPHGLGMIHSYQGAGRVVEHRIDEQWAARVVAAYSYQGVSE